MFIKPPLFTIASLTTILSMHNMTIINTMFAIIANHDYNDQDVWDQNNEQDSLCSREPATYTS